MYCSEISAKKKYEKQFGNKLSDSVTLSPPFSSALGKEDFRIVQFWHYDSLSKCAKSCTSKGTFIYYICFENLSSDL